MEEVKNPAKMLQKAILRYRFSLITARLTSKLIDIEQKIISSGKEIKK